MNPLDKIFKDKLNDYSTSAPAGAWHRISTGISKKNSLNYRRIAAALSLLVAAGVVIAWYASKTGTRDTVAMVPNPPLSNSQPKKKEMSAPAAVRKQSLQQRHVAKLVAPVKKKAPVKEAPVEVELPAEAAPAITVPQPETARVEPHASVPAEKAIVIEYRLETVAAAQPAAKERSGLRKVLDFAREAKNSTPLGDLRDAKDELLAFDFRKDKQKSAK